MERKTTLFQAVHNNVIITMNSVDANVLLNAPNGDLGVCRFCLSRGDLVAFETVEEIVEYEESPCYTSGFDGQLRETVINRTKTVIDSTLKKLWHAKGKGYYWIDQTS